MDAVLRAAIFYFILLILVRISGRRTLAQITVFDFVLLLVISEATPNALVVDDDSVTNSLIVIVPLLIIDIGLSVVKVRYETLDKLIDGVPIVIVANGTPLRDRMQRTRIDEKDVMEAARQLQGLERLDQIKFAVLEVTGGIIIIPKKETGTRAANVQE
jgi:uncharacterized membrane protein YcaP (DUF421 family)